jgi:hypothetical protein
VTAAFLLQNFKFIEISRAGTGTFVLLAFPVTTANHHISEKYTFCSIRQYDRLTIFISSSLQCELQDGERGYTSKISSPEHLSLFWDGLEDSQKMAFSKQFNVNLSSVDTSNNPYYVRKTRWQYYAEKYFTTLLGLQGEEFDPFVGRHLRALVDYKLRVEQNDPELRDIINNYISTL